MYTQTLYLETSKGDKTPFSKTRLTVRWDIDEQFVERCPQLRSLAIIGVKNKWQLQQRSSLTKIPADAVINVSDYLPGVRHAQPRQTVEEQFLSLSEEQANKLFEAYLAKQEEARKLAEAAAGR